MGVPTPWLDEHLETFVKPHLGFIPGVDEKIYSISMFSLDSIPTMLEVWEEAKRQCGERRFLLAGRDMWEFEILARIEGYPTIFRPDISSDTYAYVAKTEKLSDCYLLDTGNRGTIPKALGIENYHLLYCSGVKSDKEAHAILYPKNPSEGYNDPFYKLYCLLEGTAKYWTWAKMDKGIKQTLVDPISVGGYMNTSFLHAAMVTQFIARYAYAVRAKRFVDARLPQVYRPRSGVNPWL